MGLGCMEGTNTKENLNGASTMNELICFFNNTISSNQVGATGGNCMYAVNNVVVNNKLGGFKRFGSKSSVINNLFYQNGGNDFIEVSEKVINRSNLFGKDPMLNENTFVPLADRPCTDSGEKNLVVKGKNILKISSNAFVGNNPDIGAVEFKKIKN